MITAEHALDQNREVFVVPGNITSTKHVGSHHLIKEGAKLIHSVEDIMDELRPQFHSLRPYEAPQKIQIKLSEDEKSILKYISSEPAHIDKICQQCGLPTNKALSILLTLELKGAVRTLEGKRYIRT